MFKAYAIFRCPVHHETYKALFVSEKSLEHIPEPSEDITYTLGELTQLHGKARENDLTNLSKDIDSQTRYIANQAEGLYFFTKHGSFNIINKGKCPEK